jgi:hypothetical protein
MRPSIPLDRRHTAEELEQAARRFDQLAVDIDPATAEVVHTDDLREVVSRP